MGSQQLLLIVVGVVIVGLAVVLGFGMFEDSANAGKVDAAVSYSQNVAKDAASSVLRGVAMGGYDTFENWANAGENGSGVTAIGDYSVAYADDSLRFVWLFTDLSTAAVTINPETGGVTTTPVQ